MSLNGVLPSHHIPDYLRQDLRIGEKDTHPIAAALDEIFSKWFLLAHKSAHGILPSAWSEDNCELALEYHGFQTQSLTPESRRELFRVLPRIFAAKGNLSAILQLAAFYFPGARVQRGREDATQTERFPLRVVDGRDSLILIRVPGKMGEVKARELTRNVRLLLPDRYEVLVALEPSSPPEERKDLDIGKGFRMERRRL